MSLTFQSHISSITKTAFYHLHNIAWMRPAISTKDTGTLIHALITSRLNYCNSFLIGLPAKTITWLQYVQNSAARVISQVKKSDHITTLLYNLHWLPVPVRIQYTILLLTLNVFMDFLPIMHLLKLLAVVFVFQQWVKIIQCCGSEILELTFSNSSCHFYYPHSKLN